MARPKDLDELFVQVSEAFELVKQDPRRIGQAQEMGNLAGKMINIAKTKLVASLACGQEPSFEILGKMSGKPLKPNARLLSE